MQNNNTVETLIGAIVVAIAAAFLVFAYSTTSAGSLSGYSLEARFASADGITTGTDVRLHGIKVGTVSGVDLDSKTYLAIVRLSIRRDVQIPDDSAIKVTSSSLLGSSYLSIQPGGSSKNLPPGSQITNTQGSVAGAARPDPSPFPVPGRRRNPPTRMRRNNHLREVPVNREDHHWHCRLRWSRHDTRRHGAQCDNGRSGIAPAGGGYPDAAIHAAASHADSQQCRSG